MHTTTTLLILEPIHDVQMRAFQHQPATLAQLREARDKAQRWRAAFAQTVASAEAAIDAADSRLIASLRGNAEFAALLRGHGLSDTPVTGGAAGGGAPFVQSARHVDDGSGGDGGDSAVEGRGQGVPSWWPSGGSEGELSSDSEAQLMQRLAELQADGRVIDTVLASADSGDEGAGSESNASAAGAASARAELPAHAARNSAAPVHLQPRSGAHAAYHNGVAHHAAQQPRAGNSTGLGSAGTAGHDRHKGSAVSDSGTASE